MRHDGAGLPLPAVGAARAGPRRRRRRTDRTSRCRRGRRSPSSSTSAACRRRRRWRCTDRVTSPASTAAPCCAPTRRPAPPTASRTTSSRSTSTRPTSRGCSRPGKATGDRLRPVVRAHRRREDRRRHRDAAAGRAAAGARHRRPPMPGASCPTSPTRGRGPTGRCSRRQGSLPPADLDLDPDRNLSRLVSSRLLQPDTRYLAAVVPAFDHGVQRGLGREPIGDVVAPAWDVATVESIELPMYHFWEFTTAVADDIESMARRLHGPEHAPPHARPAADLRRRRPSRRSAAAARRRGRSRCSARCARRARRPRRCRRSRRS